MPPKGKGSGGGGGKGNGTASKKASAKVGLGFKSQEKVLALVQQQATSRGPAAQMLDMDSRKLEKRLAGMYEKLSDAGFSDSQVERALTACCLSGGESGPSLEEVLDWLCLHLPVEELPAKFADPTSKEVKPAMLDVGHVGSGISSARRQGQGISRDAVEFDTPAIQPRSMPKRGGGGEDDRVDKDWILARVEAEAQAEALARQQAKSQESARSRWASLSPEEKLTLLEKSYEEEREKARKAKEEGRMGRRDKLESEATLRDIREQITELKVVVGRRKKELKKLQDSLLADAQNPTPAQASKLTSNKGKGGDEAEADLGGMFDEEEEEEEEEVKVKPAAPAANGGKGTEKEKAKATDKENGFEASLVKGMFGDSSEDDEEEEDPAERLAKQIAALPLPSSSSPPSSPSVPTPTRSQLQAPQPTRPAGAETNTGEGEKAAQRPPPRLPSPDIAEPDALLPPVGPPTAPSSSSGPSSSNPSKSSKKPPTPSASALVDPPAPPLPPPPRNQALAGVPRNWSGKTPRKQLEEYLQKRKLGRCTFARIEDGGSGNGCVLTLRLAGEAAENGGERKFESRHEFVGHSDAQHAAATRALFELEPRLQLHRVLPPPFRDWWVEWSNAASAKREEETAALKKGKRDRIQSLVQNIRSEVRPGGGGGRGGGGGEEEGQGQGEGEGEGGLLPENGDMGWEDALEASGSGGAGLTSVERGGATSSATSTSTSASGAGKEGAGQQGRVVGRGGEEEGERLRRRFEAIRSSPKYQELKRGRDGLPVAASRREILECIDKERVVVVCGETGCGKSTQIAQYIVEDAVLRGEGHSVSVVCTQPRRVAAMALAERVAVEMGEENGCGGPTSLVGYQIRMESRAGPSTKLLFCTTGILLRRLQSDPSLGGFTHLLLDEIHERQALGDFLLIVVRDLLAARPDLRVVLMSATVNAALFCGYFGGCRCFTIPGRTFPVTAYHLEDVLDLTGHVIEEGSQYARRDSATQFKRAAFEVSGRGGKSYTQRVEWEDEAAADGVEVRGPEWAQYLEELREQGYARSAVKSLGRAEESAVNYDLIEDLLQYIVRAEPEKVAQGEEGFRANGAVLIFLPGLGEIRLLLERLKGSRSFGLESEYLLLALHSSLSSKEQQRAFARPGRGVRKIILSTNIAETSVTIDDVVYVVDSGLLREVQLANKGRGNSRALVTTWCCRASAKQRMGRAGRVGPGLCFRLFSTFTLHKVMSEFAVPEIRRVPLEELCLALRANGYSPSCHAFLSRAIEPPTELAISSAVKVLMDVGALTQPPPHSSPLETEGELTPLGLHLARLPVDVRLGKMLIFASLLRCLDPVLTIAAALSGSKSPLLHPIGKEAEARHAHSRFEVCQSDFLTLANVFAHFRVASKEARQSPAAETRYCNSHFLGRTTLREMMDLKVQYLSLLIDIGLVPKPAGFRENYEALEGYMEGAGRKGRGVNSQAGNTNLVLAAVCAGLYPNVARAVSNGPHGKPTFVVPGGGSGAQNSVSVHRSSFNGALKSFTSPWLIYHEKFTTTRVYVSPTSVVSPYALLLFGGPLSVDHLNNRVVIDDWIDFQCPARTAVLFKKMRVCLVDVLEELIRNPLGDDGARAGPVGGKEGETVLDTLVGLLQEEEPKAAWIPGGKDDPENK